MRVSRLASIARIVGILAVCLYAVSPGAAWAEPGNMVFFRGGWAWATDDRGNEVFTDAFGIAGENDDDSGWYVGAGLDLVLTPDVWGMFPGIGVLGEIGVEFKRFDSKRVAQAVPSTCAIAGVPSCEANLDTRVEITMLTVDISPKIKLLGNSPIRPWIIPIGLDFNVISPPSNDTTYLDLGVQFGAGVDYRLWQAFHLGIDARYHVGFDQTNVTTDFGTVGAYLGIAF